MFEKYKGVFTSRWKALAWAAGVCLTAYCTVPSEDGSSATEQALDSAVEMAGGEMPGHHAETRHANPWAKDPVQK